MDNPFTVNDYHYPQHLIPEVESCGHRWSTAPYDCSEICVCVLQEEMENTFLLIPATAVQSHRNVPQYLQESDFLDVSLLDSTVHVLEVDFPLISTYTLPFLQPPNILLFHHIKSSDADALLAYLEAVV